MTDATRQIAALRRHRFARLRRGAVLALLALFGQMVVSLLPMPALAADGVAALCQTTGATSPAPAKTPPHAMPDCPVCQAFHLAGHILPPAPIALASPDYAANWRPGPVAAAAPAAVSSHAHQPRAPPASV